MSHRMLIVGDAFAALDTVDRAAFFVPHERLCLRTGGRALQAASAGALLIVCAESLPDMTSADLIDFVAASRTRETGPVCVVTACADARVEAVWIGADGQVRPLGDDVEVAPLRVALERAYCEHEALVGSSGPFVAVESDADRMDAWRWFRPAAA